MFTPDDLGTDNPIEGTPLDPKRRAFISGQPMPGMLADRMMNAGGQGGDEDAGPKYADEKQPTDELMQTAAMRTPNAPMEHPDLSHGDYSPPAAAAVATSTPGPTPAPGPTPTPAPPTLMRPGEEKPPVMGPTNAPGAGGEDDIFNRIMSQNMDDTTQSNRIAGLDSKIAAMRQKPSLSRRLLNVGMMIAPTAIAGALGGGTAAGGAAAGTNEFEQQQYERKHQRERELVAQAESERGRQERQYERRLQLPITYMNMKMMRDYRNRVVDANVHRTDTQHNDKLTAMGLDQQGNEIPEDQLPPTVKSKVQAQRAHQGLYDAQTDFTEAREEMARAQNDPSSPVYQLAKKRVDTAAAALRIAQEKSDAFMLNARTREAQYYKSTFGTDVEGKQLPGSFVDPNTREPMGWNAPGNPTAGTKQRGQTAATVLPHFDDDPKNPNPNMQKGLITLIKETPDEDLGLIKGHFNEWYTGKWGADNPKLARLRDKMKLTDTAMMLSHVGQSGGIDMMNHFKDMLNLGQSKNNAYEGAMEFKGWLRGYADAGTPNAQSGAANPAFNPVSGGGNPAATTPAPARNKLARPGQGGNNAPAAVEWEKGPDGKPRPKKKVTVQ